jgi:hypothetical protein
VLETKAWPTLPVQVNASAMTLSLVYNTHVSTCTHVSKKRFETSDLLANAHGESLISYKHHVQTRSLNSV